MSRHWQRVCWSVGFCFLLIAIATGCGRGRTNSLTGRVTYQGKPLVCGNILAFGSDGLPVSCEIQPDGTYTLTGFPEGDVKVAVTSAKPVDQSKWKMPPHIAKAKQNRQKEENSKPDAPLPLRPKPVIDVTKWFPIPAQYADVSTSGLLTRVSGNQTWDIELK